MNLFEIKKLATACAVNKPSVNFSAEGQTLSTEAMNEVLRDELGKLSATPAQYERNKHDIFEIISESVDAKVPGEVASFFEGFVEAREYGMHDKPEFEIRRSNKNMRARAFITQVSSAGIYEVFRLAKQGKVQVNMKAIGGACQIAYEDFASGRISWSDLVEIVAQGMADRVLDEILATIDKVEKSLPTANVGTSAEFDPAVFEKLLGTVSVYGSPVVFCTETFARKITEGVNWASEAEKVARRNVGHLASYKGAKIVILPQSFTDETNSEKLVDDSKAYILPAGREAIFKLAYQGPTHIKEIDNSDWSKELQTYRRFGVSAFIYNDIAIYNITSLKA